MNHDIREKKIEKAVEKKEYEQAEKLTEELYQEMPPIDMTMPEDFAETIRIKSTKGTNGMNRKRIKVAFVAIAALVAISGTSAFAVNALTKYYKVEDGKLVQTTKEDKDKVMEITEEPSGEGTGDMVTPGKTYNTLETAEKETGIANMLPDGIQGYTTSSVSGLYKNQDKKQEDCLGISANFVNGDKTVLYDYFLKGALSDGFYPNGTGETDAGSTSYTNQHGVTFSMAVLSGDLMIGDEGDASENTTRTATVYTDGSSADTMRTATVDTGKGQLSISFLGMDDEEIHAVLEQVVLP